MHNEDRNLANFTSDRVSCITVENPEWIQPEFRHENTKMGGQEKVGPRHVWFEWDKNE